MHPEEKQEEKIKCLAGNVTETKGGTNGTQQFNTQKKVRPPPIIVGNVKNYQEVYNYLKNNNLNSK
jgi:hypothetical protein